MSQVNTLKPPAEAESSSALDAAVQLRVLPLGGLGEIGKNLLVLQSGSEIIVVDAGLMFPTIDMHGVDVVIPDIDYLLERADQVKGILLTHGHEDHIGALPYLIEEGLRAPIYATALTRGLLEGKLREQKLLAEVELHTITADDTVELGSFVVDFFHTCHSFPDSVGVSVQTPAGRIIHTSDYKFDPTPVDGKLTQVEKLQRWGDEGVLLLMADSTNSEQAGVTPSEKTIEPALDRIFQQAPGRVLLATFASNISRVQQIINVARQNNRRVGVTGRSMVNNVKIAIQLGYLDVTQDELLTLNEMESMNADKVVIVATGSQGEPTSALVRMSMGDHRQIKIRPGDTVVVSAAPIPGNEELFNRTIDNMFRLGADVIYHELADIHVSGHGGQGDYLRMLELVRPTYFIPVHGEYRHLVLNSRLAQQAGVAPQNVFVIEDGQTVDFGRFTGDGQGEMEARLGEQVAANHVLVDGLGVGDVGNVVLRDREHLAQDGFLVCVVAQDEFDGSIIFGPEIISRGFVYMRESEELIRGAEEVVRKALKRPGPEKVLENKIKEALSAFCYREMGRRPMVLPVVMEI